jgi:hypothetical protein
VDYAADEAATERARGLARKRTDEVLDSLQATPPQVTIQSVSGSPAGELLKASRDADLLARTVLRRALNRQRMAAWDAGWAAVEPRWNRQRW